MSATVLFVNKTTKTYPSSTIPNLDTDTVRAIIFHDSMPITSLVEHYTTIPFGTTNNSVVQYPFDFRVDNSMERVWKSNSNGFDSNDMSLSEYLGGEKSVTVPCLDLSRERYALDINVNDLWSPVVEGNCFIGGKYTVQLEQQIETFLDTHQKCIAVANGTDALEISYRAVSEQSTVPKDKQVVLVPSFTFIATAAAVKLAGIQIEFLDISDEPGNYVTTAEQIQSALHPNVVAIVGVSLFGQVPDWVEWNKVVDIFNKISNTSIVIIEDAAQSFGSGKSMRGLTDISCTSFYPSKLLGGYGDGGAILANERWYSIIRSIANHGIETEQYTHTRLGRNSRLDGLQAAILSYKLSRFADIKASRHRVVTVYNKELESCRCIVTPTQKDNNQILSQFTVQVVRGSRDNLLHYLQKHNVDARVFYHTPCHQQIAFADPNAYLPNTVNKSMTVLSFPAFPFMTWYEIKFISHLIQTWEKTIL